MHRFYQPTNIVFPPQKLERHIRAYFLVGQNGASEQNRFFKNGGG
jgi:hypothetical protein